MAGGGDVTACLRTGGGEAAGLSVAGAGLGGGCCDEGRVASLLGLAQAVDMIGCQITSYRQVVGSDGQGLLQGGDAFGQRIGSVGFDAGAPRFSSAELGTDRRIARFGQLLA